MGQVCCCEPSSARSQNDSNAAMDAKARPPKRNRPVTTTVGATTTSTTPATTTAVKEPQPLLLTKTSSGLSTQAARDVARRSNLRIGVTSPTPNIASFNDKHDEGAPPPSPTNSVGSTASSVHALLHQSSTLFDKENQRRREETQKKFGNRNTRRQRQAAEQLALAHNYQTSKQLQMSSPQLAVGGTAAARNPFVQPQLTSTGADFTVARNPSSSPNVSPQQPLRHRNSIPVSEAVQDRDNDFVDEWMKDLDDDCSTDGDPEEQPAAGRLSM